MNLFQQQYTVLFNGVTDTLKNLSEQDFGQAQTRLVQLNESATRIFLKEACIRAEISAKDEETRQDEEALLAMDKYREPYQELALGVETALQNLRDHNYGLAEARLRRAQQDAEAAFMEACKVVTGRESGIDLSGTSLSDFD